jgi:signal peptidase
VDRRLASNLRWRSASKLGVAAGRTAFTVFLIVAALLFFFLAIGPRVLNYQTSTMLTGSMSPGINPGDVVVSVKTPVSELEVGDVITYSIPIDDRRVETHRIMSIQRSDAGVTTVTTKGDANPTPDPWAAVLVQDYVYTQAGVVPHLGDVIRALRQPLVQPLIMYGGSALLVVVLLTSIWGKPADAGRPATAKAGRPAPTKAGRPATAKAGRPAPTKAGRPATAIDTGADLD